MKITTKQAIGKVQVKAGQQGRVILGTYNKAKPPKGFSIAVTPTPQDDAIVTQVTSLDINSEKYELILNIANYGDDTIVAEVRAL